MKKRQTLFFIAVSVILAVFCFVWHALFSSYEKDDFRTPVAVQDAEKYRITEGYEIAEEDDDRGNARALNVLERKAPELLAVFTEPDDWRLSANLIKVPNAAFYFLFKGEPTISEGGRKMTLNACTVVVLPHARRVDLGAPEELVADSDAATPLNAEPVFESLEERARRALIFEVSDRIELNFSRSLLDYGRLRQTKLNFSLLESGRLCGQVVVRGGEDNSRRDPPFYVETRDVAFNMRQFRTTSDVTFRLGAHSGSGVGLTIDVETPESLAEFRHKPSSPQDADEETNEEEFSDPRDRVMAQIDDIVDDGNLGVGFSIRQVEVEKIKRIHLNLAELSVHGGGADSTELDALDVECHGGAHFEPTTHRPGEWCARFDDSVSAVAWRQTERVCVFKGQALYLYFQDPLLEELETKFPEAFATLRRRNPSGALARLQSSVVRVLGGEEPVSLQYALAPDDETGVVRGVEIAAAQAYYDDVRQRFILSDRMEFDALSSPAETPTPVTLNLTEYDQLTGESNVSTLASPTIRLEFDRIGRRLLNLSAIGAGSLSSSLRAGKGERVSMQTFWKNGLQLEPDDNVQDAYLLTSSGEIRCSVEEMGSFSAMEANFWFRLTGGAPTLATEERPDASEDVSEDATRRNDMGVVPVCARFTGDVHVETKNGQMNVSDKVVVRFSDQSGTSDAKPAKATTFFEQPSKSGGLSSSGLASTKTPGAEGDRFELSCNSIEAWCELAGEVPEGASKLRLINVSLVGGAVFNSYDANNVVKAAASSDSVTVENPLTDEMRVLFHSDSGAARFSAGELSLQGRDVMIDMAQNSFQALGPGDVVIIPPAKQGTSGNRVATDALTEPITVSWTRAMVFDGQAMRFQALEGTDVTLVSASAGVACGETRLVLKKNVDMLNLQFDGVAAPEVDYIECVAEGRNRPVRLNYNVRSQEPGSDEIEGYYGVVCQSVRVNVGPETFTINDQGEFQATILSEGGVPELSADGLRAATGASAQNSESERQWVRVSARFDSASGSLKDGVAEVTGGVDAIVSNVDDPSSKLNVDRLESVPDSAVTFRCRQAVYRSAGKSAAAEVEARGNVSFRTGELSGYCESLGYSSAKNVVTLSGSGTAMATLERQAYSGAPRSKVAEFMHGRVHLDTKKFEVEDLTFNGDPSMLEGVRGASRESRDERRPR